MLMATVTLAAILLVALLAHRAGHQPSSEPASLAQRLDTRASVAFVFSTTFAVVWYSWAAWSPRPVVHDEMAYVLQAQIFARGMWALPSPSLPAFWQQIHILTEPRLASKYFPGHSLVMTPGALLGWPALMPLVLQSTIAALLFVLARRVASGGIAFLAWTTWLFSPMVLYLGSSYYSEATTTACWLAGWYALLEWRTTRKLPWLLAIAFFTAWCAITRPLTGLAYAIPMAMVVLRDVVRDRRWRDLALAVGAGTAVLGILLVWSARTTGDWRITPLALYTRMYMPFDVPGFGLIATPPAHALTPELERLNRVYSAQHVTHVPSHLIETIGERSHALWLKLWETSSGILGLFAILGLLTLNASTAFAVGSGVFLLVMYLSYGTPAEWTLYYYESTPAYALLAAAGMAWAASVIGRPARAPDAPTFHWGSARWTRALVSGGLVLALPGIMAMQLVHRQHIDDRKYLAAFDGVLASIHDARAVVFVRYAASHDPHITFVRNRANPDAEQIWVVYDRGDRENLQLLARAPERRPYLFDETVGQTYLYDPRVTR
jgi:hypothetical protein